jgi:heme/copper-type cytochrome/quinol oxidase subunit 4
MKNFSFYSNFAKSFRDKFKHVIVEIMDASLKLFLIGFVVSIIVTIILDQSEVDEEGFMKSFVTKGAKLWQLVFMLTVLTTIPFMVIEPLKKRFTRKTFLPFPFLGGYGTGFLLMGSIGMILSIGS